MGDAAAATRSANVSASSRAAVTSTGRGDAEPNDARSSSPAETASDTTAITIALRGPIFMNVCGAFDRVSQTAVIISSSAEARRVLGERVALHAGYELGHRHAARPARRRALHLGGLDEERRDRVAGGRRRAEVAADRAAVPDLRRADGARRLRERRQDIAQLAI